MQIALTRLARRGSLVAAAYLATSAITLAVLFVFARRGEASLLRSVLAAQFIASLAAGLDPATTKALALNGAFPRAHGADRRAILMASAVKALVASPIFILIWLLSDPSAGWAILACSPLVCIAGFTATDLRVLFDLEGRHARAIWLKQGSLGGGLVILAVLTATGMPVGIALAVASVARIGLAIVVGGHSRGQSDQVRSTDFGAMLRDPRWISLAGASVVAAIGGSADRLFGLRYLSPSAWAGYYALYEVFSKFWFIPYVFAPIVFARTVGGLDSMPVSRAAWRLTIGVGSIFVLGVGVALLVFPDLTTLLLGARLGAGLPPGAVVAFAAAVAIGSLGQIRIAEIQGRGGAHRSLVIMATSAALTTALFYGAARAFGAAGLLYAWVVKSSIDLGLTYLGPKLPHER